MKQFENWVLVKLRNSGKVCPYCKRYYVPKKGESYLTCSNCGSKLVTVEELVKMLEIKGLV